MSIGFDGKFRIGPDPQCVWSHDGLLVAKMGTGRVTGCQHPRDSAEPHLRSRELFQAPPPANLWHELSQSPPFGNIELAVEVNLARSL
jgi:hypothetical protein